MITRDMSHWETEISEVISNENEEEILIRGHRLSELIGNLSFAGAMFLMLQGKKPSDAQTRVLDALLVASMEHGIAPPSMVSRCFASYGTSIQAAIGGGVISFGDRMGGLGEQLAKLMFDAVGRTGLTIGDRDKVAACAREIVNACVGAGVRVPGYGIPLHATDPRAPQVLAVAKREGTFGIYGALAEAIESTIAAQRGGRSVPMNLDGVGAAVILDLGFDWRSTRMFLITPRTVSMGTHFLEEVEQDSIWRHLPAETISYSTA
ncbi:MAG: citrate/2-methylcitrate synthase [Pseudomonadota bacterium]